MWSEFLGYHRPAHDLVNGEEFEKLSFKRYLGIARISVNAVKKIRLFVVVRGKDDVEYDSL